MIQQILQDICGNLTIPQAYGCIEKKQSLSFPYARAMGTGRFVFELLQEKIQASNKNVNRASRS